MRVRVRAHVTTARPHSAIITIYDSDYTTEWALTVPAHAAVPGSHVAEVPPERLVQED